MTEKKKTGGKGKSGASAMSDRTDGRRALDRLLVLSRAVEQSPSVVLITDATGKIEYVNPRFTVVTGYTVEEAIDKHVSDLEDRSPEEQQRVWKILASGAEWRGELRGKGKSGEAFWLSASITPIRSRDGVITHYLGAGEDITERKRGETALRKSEEQYRDLVENLNDVIYEVDATGRITYVSPVIEEFAGYNPSELFGRTFNEFVEPDDRERVLEGFETTLGGYLEPIEYRISTKCGDVRWVRADSRPIVREGRTVGLRGVLTDINERKQAEEALRQSEERFRSAFEHAATGMALVRPDGHLLQVNRACWETLGYTERELTSTTWQAITHPDDLDITLHHVRRVLAGESDSFQLEKRFVHKLGHMFWGHITSSLLRDAEGSPLYFITQIQDITTRKRAEESLRESEMRFRQLVEEMKEGLGVQDENGLITYVNDRLCEILRRSREEMIGLPIAAIVHEDDLAVFKMNMTARREGRGTSYELAFKTKDGEKIMTLLSGQPLFGPEGEPRGSFAVMMDITERKRAEEALREREETMLALINAPTESALLADIDGTILAMNEIAAQRLGKSVDEIVGGTALDLMPPDAADFRKAKGEEVQRSGKPCRFQDTREGRWYDTTIYPIFDADGKVVRLAIFSSDITEIKEMEEALQKTREELDRRVERQMQRGDPYGLTYRELTVLHLVVAGSSDKEIGTTLGISTPTASKHITNILSKMHASSRTEAGVRALKEGLLD